MFVIGLIVGFVLGGVLITAGLVACSMKLYNLSWQEVEDTFGLLYEAGNNRESTLTLTKDGTIVDAVTLEEK